MGWKIRHVAHKSTPCLILSEQSFAPFLVAQSMTLNILVKAYKPIKTIIVVHARSAMSSPVNGLRRALNLLASALRASRISCRRPSSKLAEGLGGITGFTVPSKPSMLTGKYFVNVSRIFFFCSPEPTSNLISESPSTFKFLLFFGAQPQHFGQHFAHHSPHSFSSSSSSSPPPPALTFALAFVVIPRPNALTAARVTSA
mmetsp:Transcript_83144/g.144484  ORF Transcript_83144/g.144484 Transcript_83144/m.144484 type:complete len:200 (-) Transcript_83144:719-1318(-)